MNDELENLRLFTELTEIGAKLPSGTTASDQQENLNLSHEIADVRSLLRSEGPLTPVAITERGFSVSAVGHAIIFGLVQDVMIDGERKLSHD